MNPPAPSTVTITSPMGERARRRVPRRIEHFQGELTTLEERVLLHADGRIGFAEIARRLGISEQEVVAVALSLSGIGAIVLTAVPPPIPKRPASGTRTKVLVPANTQRPEEPERAGMTRVEGIAGLAEMTEVELEIVERVTDQEVELQIEVDLDLSELERLIRPPTRR